MGKTGTDVAKAASDIQLLDDNFCSILVAVKYGRNIYDNIRKFLQFQLTVNVVAMFIVFSGAIIFSDAPLTSVQMLWVNLIMDTFAALALATEPPNDTLLDRLPADRNEKIVNHVMWRNIFGQGIFQIGVLMCLLFFPMQLLGLEYDASMPFYPTSMDARAWAELNGSTVAEYPYPLNEPTVKVEHYTFVFQTFVFMQLFNQINARKLGDKEFNVFASFFNNAWFICLTILTFAIQWFIVEHGGKALRCMPLSFEENAWCLGIGAFSLIWGVIIKVILPSSWFTWMSMDEHEQTDKEDEQSFQRQIRKSFRQSRSVRLSNRASQRSNKAINED